MNIDDIEKAHEIDDNQFEKHCIGTNYPPPSIGRLLTRESTLIAMVRQLEADKAGLVEALKEYARPTNWIRPYHINGQLQDKRALYKHGNNDGHNDAAEALTKHGGSHE